MTKRVLPTNLSHLSIDDLDPIFRSDDQGLLEELAQAAAYVTRVQFGRVISLYAPLYIANFCQNRCAYCGFQATNTEMPRKRLSTDEIDSECRALASTGIRSCLILTGESRHHTPPSYIQEAVVVASHHFPHVALEVYPLKTEEYRALCCAGADGVTIFQETYNRIRYDELHVRGPKKDYNYRFETPERIARAGFRQLSMGILLGLSDWRKDVPELFRHVRYLERKYPGVEYALSLPRLRPVANDSQQYFQVTNKDFVKIMCVSRLLFPRAGINVSTRESPAFRDRILGLGVTRMSAGSLTTVGGYAAQGNGGNRVPVCQAGIKQEQFEVHDPRSLEEIKAVLLARGFDPVLTDWRNIENQ